MPIKKAREGRPKAKRRQSRITHPTRLDAERLLNKARAEVRTIMKNELDAERIPGELWVFRMRAIGRI